MLLRELLPELAQVGIEVAPQDVGRREQAAHHRARQAAHEDVLPRWQAPAILSPPRPSSVPASFCLDSKDKNKTHNLGWWLTQL